MIQPAKNSRLKALWLVALSLLLSVESFGVSATPVERGRYLAIAGNCVACHTRPGGAAYAGGLPFETPFGVIHSSNITPDTSTGIGRWTLQQFSQALRSGLRADGQHLYPVFPYTAYTQLRDEDVAALYAYFRSLRPVRSGVRPNAMKFPFGERRLLGFWKQLYFREERFTEDPARGAAWNRGAYLVNALGHCSACHSPRNRLGAESSALAMTGAVHPHTSPDGRTRQWSSSNLTGAKAGLAAWTTDDLTAYLGRGISNRAAVFGPMNEVVASLRQLTEADVRAMAIYLKSLPPVAQEGGRAEIDVDTLSEGRVLYNVHCGTCHQPDGSGSVDTGPPLAGSAVVNAPGPQSLINAVLRGPERPRAPPSVDWQRRRWKMMEAFGDKLADDEIAAIATYVRNAWGHTGSAVDEDTVARQR